MSWKKALWASCLAAAILLAPATLKAQGNYLDVYIAKVKPEKALEAEAIAKKITDAHGGHIEVKSTVGKGSSFIVYLPSA